MWCKVEKRNLSSTSQIVFAFALLMGFERAVLATEATGTIGTRLEHSDNVREASSNKQSDFIQVTYGEIGVEEVRKRFKADANLKVENEHYYDNTYDDETSLTSGFGLFTVDLVEQFLEWSATFSRTDVVSDSAEDENPDTREFRNILRTGPSINYAISRTTNFRLNANYVRVDNSEETADDSQRAEGSAVVSHQINRLTSVNMNGRYSEVIESDDDEEIENSSLGLGFNRSYVDGALSASYGLQEVRSNLAETEKGAFADASLSRQNLFAHNFLLKYNHSISDTSIGFEGDESGVRDLTDPTQASSTTDIETRDRVSMTISRDGEFFLYDLNLIYEESDFKIQNYTERYRSATLGYSHKVYSRLTPRIQYSYIRENFGITQPEGEDITQTLQLSMKYQLVEDLFTDAFIEYESRSNDTVSSREYDEFSLGLGIRWEFF